MRRAEVSSSDSSSEGEESPERKPQDPPLAALRKEAADAAARLREAEQAAVEQASVQRLQQENERLRHELRVTKEALRRSEDKRQAAQTRIQQRREEAYARAAERPAARDYSGSSGGGARATGGPSQ